jgi:nitroreductase
MHKPAPIQFPIIPALQNRWSPRAFSNQLVEREKILSLLEAARWSQSANNNQPWRFILATRDNEVQFNAMLQTLGSTNRRWCQDVPLLVMIVAETTDADGNLNRYAAHDCGIALANLTIQAVEMGLMVHPMAGFKPDIARTTFTIPDTYDPMTVVAIGYYGNMEQLAEDLQAKDQKPRVRKPFEEWVYSGTFGQAAPLVKE